jgi:hypothetical protein
VTALNCLAHGLGIPHDGNEDRIFRGIETSMETIRQTQNQIVLGLCFQQRLFICMEELRDIFVNYAVHLDTSPTADLFSILTASLKGTVWDLIWIP